MSSRVDSFRSILHSFTILLVVLNFKAFENFVPETAKRYKNCIIQSNSGRLRRGEKWKAQPLNSYEIFLM